MEQRWRAVCIERCKHGSERGLRRPTAEMRQGGAFLLLSLIHIWTGVFDFRKRTGIWLVTYLLIRDNGCGGFMYLHEQMEDMGGVFRKTCGVAKVLHISLDTLINQIGRAHV